MLKPAHHEAPRNIISRAEPKVKRKMYKKITKNVVPDLLKMPIDKQMDVCYNKDTIKEGDK